MKRSLILSVVVILCCAIGHSYDFSYENPFTNQIQYFNIISEGDPDDPYNIPQGAWANPKNSSNPDYFPSATCEATYKSAIEGEDGVIYNSDYDISGYTILPYVAVYNGKRYLVTRIGDHAFENCAITETGVNLTCGMKVGKCAFKNCTSLKQMGLDCTYEVDDSAFYNCKSLEYLHLFTNTTPTLKRIGDAAFYGCTSLKVVAAYNDCILDAEVGKEAFYHQTENPRSCEIQLMPKKYDLKSKLEQMFPWNKFYINVLRLAGIDGVEAEVNECDDSVYGLGGQLLRHSGVGTAGLPAGLYIQGGKIIKVN